MRELLWLIPALPLAGFLCLALAAGRLPRRVVSAIGVGSVGFSTLVALAVGWSFTRMVPAGGVWSQKLWTWWRVGQFAPEVALTLDPLALVFVLVITGVGFLIHLYSTEYMAGDEGYSRFFAYMNLFVAAMLTLVLADNLVLLYLGWEGVGLCSYLLIGFWYRDAVNGRAARKAFIVTRIGDTALALGLFLLFWNLGTLQIRDLLGRAGAQWPIGSALATTAALLLLGGAVGKSAQLPLQTWLPDAMAGPTPVSALIHAATMVTAGVYLIARTHTLFALAPAAMAIMAAVGAVTLLLAACSALVQSDVKRVLAYSTISQIGYMFLALGVGAWSAAILHFMTHAFFKALLFLAAGAVILALHHEQDIFRMGGLRARLPAVFWTFLIGAASLTALPLVTAGFYSKDLILWKVWSLPQGSPWLWAAGMLGALLTGLYAFRLVFLVFYGPERTTVTYHPGRRIGVPLVILAALALAGGFCEIPPTLGGWPAFSRFLEGTFGGAPEPVHSGHATEALLQVVTSAVTLLGLCAAYFLFLRRPAWARAVRTSSVGRVVHRLWAAGWGFDALYDRLVVRPYDALARLSRSDVIDRLYTGLAAAMVWVHGGLTRTQTGRLRTYAVGIALGAIIALAIMVLA